MQSSNLLRGLYAVTDTALCSAIGVENAVTEALEGGASLVQYRDKSREHDRRAREARALSRICQDHGVPFIVNDDIELALEVGAAGVHLGRDDESLSTARARLGVDAIIGVSCYHRIDLAHQAAHAGASYIAFGRFFNSSTKPGPPLANASLLSQARRDVALPIAAIGGITAHNAPPLLSAGASMLACIHSVFAAPDIRGAAQRINALFAALGC